MTTRITTYVQAVAELARLAQTGSKPVLTPDEVQGILDNRRRAVLWDDATAYAVGDVVQPNIPDGHRYVCVVAGTSAATEPTWSMSEYSQVSDGATLVWQEAGIEYLSLWDMQGAAYDAWDLKLSKAICAVDTQQGDTRISASQIFDHLRDKRDGFIPVAVA